MTVENSIAYAENRTQILKVNGVRAMENHCLWVRFNTGEAKIYDMTPLLSQPAFLPLRDNKVFQSVFIDYGTPVWNDGEIDIAPEELYAKGTVVPA